MRSPKGVSRSRWVRGVGIIGLTTLATVLAWDPAAGGGRKRSRDPAPRRPPSREDLQVVDCSLPGQVRKLGRQQTYVSRRRPIRTTALDCGIRGGEYVAFDRANYETALRVWLETAEAGDPQAQYYVGEIYDQGLGREPDHAQAAEWYRKAAEKGHVQAQISLGFLYEKGLGLPQDSRQALEWYRKASGVTGVILLDSEMHALQEEMRDVRARLEAAEAASAAREIELQAARRELEQARDAGQRATAVGDERARRVAELERKLTGDRQEIATMRVSLERHNIAGPTIEIIDASVTRGATGAGASSDDELIGRVEAPAGLARLMIDGTQQSVQDGGFFHFRAPKRRVTLLAVDLQGKTAQLVHDLDARRPPAAAAGRPPTRKLGSYYALVIGNSDYLSMPRLATAAQDATAVSQLLRDRYGFTVTLLENAKCLEILSAVDKLRETLGESDNLLIYYAGHGDFDSTTDLGYWLGTDAEKDRKTNWISSREISRNLDQLRAKHVLVIADSCYSGFLTRSSLARFESATQSDRSRWLAEVAVRRSRTALTSGGLEPVLDAGASGHSIFARSFMETLSQNREILETYRLWSSVKARVMFDTRALRREQVPEYAPIQNAGHGGGEFFFVPLGS